MKSKFGFHCPICGGQTFRSNQLAPGPGNLERYCTGIVGVSGLGLRCNFKWLQKDDDKFIKNPTMEEWMAEFDEAQKETKK